MLAFKRKPLAESSDRRILEIPVGDIRPNPCQPRKFFDPEGLRELSESIRQNGVLQPITVRELGGGYELIAGERRLRAAALAGLAKIPAQVWEAGDGSSALLALTENLQRQNLHYLEEAAAYATLISEYGLTQEELARRLGKRQSTIANKLRLLRLSPEIQRELRETGLSERHARSLLRIPDPELREGVLQAVKRRELSVRETEELVEKTLTALRARPEPLPRVQKETLAVTDIRLLTNSIRQSLSLMERAGMQVELSEAEDGDGYHIAICIKKE